MPKKDYSHLPPALRPKSKKVKEKQRAQAQRVRSKAAQTKARKTSKAKDKWGNVKQAVQDVRSSDAVALGAMVLGRGRGKGGGVKLPKFKRLELPKAPRITKAKAAAKARVTQAKGRLKVAKEGRASEKKAKAEARTKILQTAGKKTRRSRHLTRKSSPGTKKAAERLLQDNLKVQRVVEKGRASSASTRKALRGHDAKDPLHKAFGGQQSKRDASGGRRVVSAKKALKRAQTTASTPVKPRAKAKRGKR